MTVEGKFNRAGSPRRIWLLVLSFQLVTTAALAQEEKSAAPSLPDTTTEEETTATPSSTQLLEERIAELNQRIQRAEEARQAVSPLSFNGYVDFGFFAGIGNRGAGWIRDDLSAPQFPQYSNFTWVFLGDILGTPVNTRGEVADLGDGSGVTRYDSVDSDGKASFILNEVNLRPRYALSENAIMRSSINFAPRNGSDFALGDTVDVDLAELEYLITKDGKTSFFAGKILPVFGIEYKERKSDQRFGITPSLIGRYTMGPQLGLKIRSKLLNDWLVLAASVTNNSSVTEQFHFYSEIDKNWGKTLNGRGAISIPVGTLWRGDDRLEIGLSGEWGPQDRASNVDGKIWFAGVDLQMLGANYAIKAQVMQGKAPGRYPEAWGLDLKPSGYIEANWMILPIVGVLARGEIRDAIVTFGTERLYLTKQARVTGGVRAVINPHMMVKLEYLYNLEYGGIREFRNDVFTSSLVLAF